jgi:hypothetical protein
MSGCEPPIKPSTAMQRIDEWLARTEHLVPHRHTWAVYDKAFGFIGPCRCGVRGFLLSRCPCGAKRFLGGYHDARCNQIVERLNRSWRVR